MFCMNCGTRLPEGVKFCSKCGSPQTQPEAFEPDFQEEETEPAVDKSESNYSESDDYEEDYIRNEDLKEEETDADGGDDIEEEDEDDTDTDTDTDEDDADVEDEMTPSDSGEKNFASGNLENSEKPSRKNLAGLSILSRKKAEAHEETVTAEKNKPLTPANDPYWNDVLPEINDELYQIPKDTIAKVIGIVAAVAASIAWLIFMLPNF